VNEKRVGMYKEKRRRRRESRNDAKERRRTKVREERNLFFSWVPRLTSSGVRGRSESVVS
jgi:hypothetical protein